jgi:hypothetical protein
MRAPRGGGDVVFEVAVLSDERSIHLLVRMLARYLASVLEFRFVGALVVGYIVLDPNLRLRFAAEAQVIYLVYRPPLRVVYGALVPEFGSPEEELTSRAANRGFDLN